MKGNNKGFTLIELLAAVVILAILFAFGLPLIFSLLDNSKNKMYINDAKRLIAQAEYKINSNSSEIEKPDEGDCILISLLYLDSSDFDNPPGEGKYEREASYVVVKNDGGKLKYAVTLIERLKRGGYKGVDLISKEELLTKDAIKKVIAFDPDDVLNVETDVNRGFLNEKLGEFFMSNENSISAIYNYSDIADNSASTGNTKAPKIVSASVISNSTKYFNSLDATLSIKVEDKDTPRDQLTLYITIDDNSTITRSYGTGDVFNYTINFREYGKSYAGGTAKIKIEVKDPEKHSSKKTITYKIHKNLPPEIRDDSSVTRRDSDMYFPIGANKNNPDNKVGLNMLTAKVSLNVSDDLDDHDDIKVCFAESPTNTNIESCDIYRKYYDYFREDNTMDYTFKNCPDQPGGKCVRDGSTHYLTIFVQDSMGEIAKKKYSYTFSVNQAPKINANSVTVSYDNPNPDRTNKIREGNKKIKITVTADDDVDDELNDLKVQISDGAKSTTHDYSNSQSNYGFTIYGMYDGKTKTIKVTVLDSEGGSDYQTRSYTVYLNKAPTIEGHFSISSHGTACLNSSDCPVSTKGGSKLVDINLTAVDDINDKGLSFCLTLNPYDSSTCTKVNYLDYKEKNKNTTYKIPHIYDDSTIPVYLILFDDEGKQVQQSVNYKLYLNNAPVITPDSVSFTSKPNSKPPTGSLNTIFNVAATDDVDTADDLKVTVIEGHTEIISNQKLSDYMNKSKDLRLLGTHDGISRNLQVIITDTDGATDSKSVTYDVYDGDPPEIGTITRKSSSPCIIDKYCEARGNYKVEYTASISDDIDDNSDMQMCASEDSEDCTDFAPYSTKTVNYTFSVDDPSKPYNGATKTLYVYIKDTDNNVVKSSKNYTLYTNQPPRIKTQPTITSSESGYNSPAINYSLEVDDDLDLVKNLKIAYCYRINNGGDVCTSYKKYQDSVLLKNSDFLNANPPKGETYTIYSKIKDTYGEEVVSETRTYTVYNDNDPSIYSKEITSGTRIYKNGNTYVRTLDGISNPNDYSPYTRIKVKFSVDDPHDTYKICVSESPTQCSNYSDSYTANNCSSSNCGNTRQYYTYTYDKPGFINGGDNVALYIFAKDSYNQVTTTELYVGEHEECRELNEEEGVYEYTFNSSSTNSHYGHNKAISMSNCSGKCYYSSTNNLKARYTASITYADKLNNTYVCTAGNPVIQEVEADCSFKDCFKKNNNYQRYAIGTTLHSYSSPKTVKIDNKNYTCTGYYKLYLTSYIEGDRAITPNEIDGVEICNTAVDTSNPEDSPYHFDSTSSNPYVRIAG